MTLSRKARIQVYGPRRAVSPGISACTSRLLERERARRVAGASLRNTRSMSQRPAIWVVVAAGLMVSSIWFDGVRLITRAVGAWTPSSTLFFFGLVFLLVLCLNYAVRLSGISGQVTALAQEVSLLREELGRLKPDAAAARPE